MKAQQQTSTEQYQILPFGYYKSFGNVVPQLNEPLDNKAEKSYDF